MRNEASAINDSKNVKLGESVRSSVSPSVCLAGAARFCSVPYKSSYTVLHTVSNSITSRSVQNTIMTSQVSRPVQYAKYARCNRALMLGVRAGFEL